MWRLGTLRTLSLFALGVVIASQAATRPPVFGQQTSDNRYRARLVPIFTVDFENGLDDVQVLNGRVDLTSNPAEVLSGKFSLRLSGERPTFMIKSERLALEPFKTYIVEYEYRILRRGNPDAVAGVALVPPGKAPIPTGRGPLPESPLIGTSSAGMRLGDDSGATFALYAIQGEIVIDNIRVSRHDADSYRARIPIWKTGFPRLALYNLTTPEETALRTHLPLSEVERVLARYDLITGTDIDHTLGAAAWVSRLRNLNPEIRILPYQESFMAHFLESKVVNDSAGLNALFNRGLAKEWLMVSADGKQLIEPDYPLNVQMDHTGYCPRVAGATFNEYMADYLSQSVLPSGLWDGIHFDQPEWYPNPLLIRRNSNDPFPPIDLRRTGRADSPALLHVAWLEGFFNYFRIISDRFGFGQLMFGNAGYMPRNTTVLPSLNGWLGEIISPYTVLPNGDWYTGDAAGWYRLFTNYLIADRFGRAPQVTMLQITGQGLGQATGTLTANGLPDRTPKLEVRDFQRMRLGLTTALMGNGFFTYALVDNSTAPPWFDEYAVDGFGRADTEPAHRHYLGQPLGAAAEIEYANRFLFSVDFESGQVSPLFNPSPSHRITFNPDEVVGGRFSMVVSRDDKDPRGLIFTTNPQTLRLEPGKVYQLFMDYKVLDYQPRTFLGLLGLGISGVAEGLTKMRTDSLYLPDTFGKGQRGSLRSSVKVSGGDFVASAALTDFGTVAVDNIRLVEGSGGVWRRDFENGVVLVNPTPEPILATAAQIAGPLKRTGLRRIQGSQAPQWNTGQAVGAGITIPSADGIILLADRIAPAAPTAPTGVVIGPTRTPGEAVLTWRAGAAPAAGYHIRYGEDVGMLTREATAGAGAQLVVPGLEPGVMYYFQIAAFDFSGRFSDYTAPMVYVSAGSARRRPVFTLAPETLALVPGARAAITGLELADSSEEAPGQRYPDTLGGVSVLLNGVKVPLSFVSPRRIEFLTPWEIAGDDVLISVLRNGLRSADRLVPRQSAQPFLFDDAVEVSGGTISVLAEGLGLVEPPPANGTPPAVGRAPVTAAKVEATIDGKPVEVRASFLAPGAVGKYLVTLSVPDDLGEGWKPVRLIVDGFNSNDIYVFFE